MTGFSDGFSSNYFNSDWADPSSGNWDYWSGSSGQQKQQYFQGAGQGLRAGAQLQGFKDSGFIGAHGSGSQNYLQQLKDSHSFQANQNRYSQSFDEYYAPIAQKNKELFKGVRDKAQSIYDDPNPSRMPISSYEQNYSRSANPIHGQMRQMKQSLLEAGRAGGNRSGLSELASLGPAAMGAGALGNAGAAASAQTYQDEARRGEVNAGVRQNALNTINSASQAEAGMLNQALGVYGAQQNSAMQAAMAAIMQMLGLQASQSAKWNIGPNGLNVSGSF